ncbi:hypothetical protein [Lentibacillus cibarius]|nr:hypothetical protein [Lentibacillus cibarius]
MRSKFKNVLSVVFITFIILAIPHGADAASYKAQKGDSFWLIANKYASCK